MIPNESILRNNYIQPIYKETPVFIKNSIGGNLFQYRLMKRPKRCDR